MQQVDTQEGSGENVAASSSNKPTLKEFISQKLGQINDLYNKLTECGVEEIETLIYIDKDDLKELCNELKLSFGDKMKFKAKIRELQHVYKPKQQLQHSIITISPKEQSYINQIELLIKQSNDLQHIFEAHFNEIDENITNTKTQINTEIDNAIQILENRKKSLHEKLDEWKMSKLENINKETANIIEYSNELKKIRNEINDLLTKGNINKRDKKISELVNNVCNNNEFKVYENMKLLKEYMEKNTKLIGIIFEDMINMKELQLFGKLNNNIESNIFNIASIVLNNIIKTQGNENGYKVKLEWELISNEEYKTNDFNVKYVMNNNNIFDDEKEENEIKYESINWIVLNEPKMKRIEKNKYSLHVSNYFKYDKLYQFEIQYMIEKPLNIIIKSNIKNINVKMETFNLDMSKQEHILLNIHSHKGHESSYPPERILNSNDEYYLSTCGQITNDWIIFDIKDNNMYYPTKLQVRARGTKYNSSSGDRCALKRFGLKIGNVDSNEWIEVNENIFTASKMDPNLQTFNLDIMNNNNKGIHNRTVQKWKSIKAKKYKQFKLDILDHYGQGRIEIQEFKIFGVKM